MNKVGIVIINFNSMNYLGVTMESILAAKTNVPYAVGVIDNGSSEEERKACEQLVDKLSKENPNLEIKFFDAGKNLGFSGGNNVVIRHFMEQPEITHICLLNSDVIVTDNWLDYMLEKDKDVIGPVTNAAGNEQTIQIDYSVEPNSDAIAVVNDYAAKRHTCYNGYVVESELVTFFATIFKREVIEKIGLLDEQFYPGSYEDDDYCVRILNDGFHITIARDCFLHHFGSGSFAKLNMNDRKNIGNINRERFEKKWNRPWKDRTWKLLESCKQDMDYLLKKDGQEWPKKQIDSSLTEIEKLIEDWGEAIKFFTTQAEKTNAPVYDYSAKQLVMMLGSKAKRRLGRIKGKMKTKVQSKVHQKEHRQQNEEGMVKIYQLIEAAKKEGHQSICVFAPMYNQENEKDGYVQRIKAIDNTVLKDMCRIYLYDEGTDCMAMRFDFIDALHGYIVFNSHNRDHLNEILKLVKTCGKTYTHSVLRFIEDRTSRELWQIFDFADVKHFWDMHGTVPEEYELSGSELGCQLANNIEEVMANKVDVVVAVTEAMGRYLRQKYPQMQAEVIVVPIFNKDLLEPIACEKKSIEESISVVYAGGTQPWQNIDLMQDVMEATRTMYEYKMFVPNPDEFHRLWGARSKDINMVVESKSPADLYKEYETCDFGFVLRDSCPVNYVACPTKIIEYLKFGIIPVLKSTEIGDFIDLGMQYVPYTDLMNGLKIIEDERQKMLENNYKILDKLMQTYIDGIAKLKVSVEQGIVIKPVEPKGDKPVVGIVVTTFDKGGLEQVVLNLYNGYKKQGYEVYMLCQENILGIMAEQVAEGEMLVFNNSMKTFLNTLYDKHITLLHYHYNIFGCQEAKARGVHTIYTMHNVYTWKSDKEIKEYSEVLNTMDKVIPVSNLVKNYYLARTSAREDNLQVVYNGIDFEELSGTELPEYLERKALGLAEDDVVMGFVASFYPVKYQIGMIGVMEELIKTYPNAKLLFIGNCENAYHQEFMKEYEQSPAKDHMIHVPYFEHKYIGEFLRRVVDIFTLPTLQEGCSNAVLEAIYCDKPMVLTNVGNAMDVQHLDSCEVVRAAYDNVVTTSNEKMIQISTKKDSANKKELVEAYTKVISQLDTYKQAAALSGEEKAQYETAYMVQQYVNIIEETSK